MHKQYLLLSRGGLEERAEVKFYFIYLFVLTYIVTGCFVHMYVCALFIRSACEGQRALGSLELPLLGL